MTPYEYELDKLKQLLENEGKSILEGNGEYLAFQQDVIGGDHEIYYIRLEIRRYSHERHQRNP